MVSRKSWGGPLLQALLIPGLTGMCRPALLLPQPMIAPKPATLRAADAVLVYTDTPFNPLTTARIMLLYEGLDVKSLRASQAVTLEGP